MKSITKYLGLPFFLTFISLSAHAEAPAEMTAEATPEAAATPEAVSAQSPASAQEEVAASPEPAEPLAAGNVMRSTFTSAVQQREPTDQLASLNNDQGTIFFFSELGDLQGQTVTHRWEYDGKIVAEVPFSVGGSRWRVWSSKSLMPEWTGTWTVSVVNGSGSVISTETFEYQQAPVAAPQEEQASATASPAVTSGVTAASPQ